MLINTGKTFALHFTITITSVILTAIVALMPLNKIVGLEVTVCALIFIAIVVAYTLCAKLWLKNRGTWFYDFISVIAVAILGGLCIMNDHIHPPTFGPSVTSLYLAYLSPLEQMAYFLRTPFPNNTLTSVIAVCLPSLLMWCGLIWKSTCRK